MDERRIRVYQCEDSPEGILSAVYAAYHSRYGHKYIRISEDSYENLDFFSEYIIVETDYENAESVARSIRRKISHRAWEAVLMCALSDRKGKGQDIYRFLNYGYEMGSGVINCLGEEHIRRVMLDRKTVSRELDRMRGFTRFMELGDGTLFGVIGPKNHLLPLLAPHFADRFPEERWIIYDEKRNLMAVHYSGEDWQLVRQKIDTEWIRKTVSRQQQSMEQYWSTFFHTIGIEERKNPKQQQQKLPQYYRKYFSKSGDKSFD